MQLALDAQAAGASVVRSTLGIHRTPYAKAQATLHSRSISEWDAEVSGLMHGKDKQYTPRRRTGVGRAKRGAEA